MGQLASDDFNRADETPLASPWVQAYSNRTFDLVSNHVVPTALLDTVYIYSGATWPADQWSFAALTVTGGTGGGDGPGVCVRWDGATINGYWLVASHGATNNVHLWQVDDGSFNALTSFTQAWTDGDVFGLRVSGPTNNAFLEVFYNGALLGSTTDTSSAIPASGSAGMVYSSSPSGPQLDRWSGGTGAFDLPRIPPITLPTMAGRW